MKITWRTILMCIIHNRQMRHKNSLTKIRYLGIHMCIKQDIFRFQISMDHHMPVTVIHARKDLLEQTSTFLFIQLRKVERHLKGASFKTNFPTNNSPDSKLEIWETFQRISSMKFSKMNQDTTHKARMVGSWNPNQHFYMITSCSRYYNLFQIISVSMWHLVCFLLNIRNV